MPDISGIFFYATNQCVYGVKFIIITKFIFTTMGTKYLHNEH